MFQYWRVDNVCTILADIDKKHGEQRNNEITNKTAIRAR